MFAPDRYGDYAVLKATKEEVLEGVEEKVTEFSHWHQVHQVRSHLWHSIRADFFVCFLTISEITLNFRIQTSPA